MQHDLGSATSFSGRQLSFEKGWKVSSTWKSWRLQMALESSLLRHRSPSPSLSFSLSLSLCLSLSFCFNCPFHALLYYCCWTERLVGEKKPRLFEKNRFGFEKSKLPSFFLGLKMSRRRFSSRLARNKMKKMLDISDNLTFWIGVANARFGVISFHRWVQLIESKSVKKRIITNCFLTSTKVHVARPEVFFFLTRRHESSRKIQNNSTVPIAAAAAYGLCSYLWCTVLYNLCLLHRVSMCVNV